MHILVLQSSDKTGKRNAQGPASWASAGKYKSAVWIVCNWWLPLMAEVAMALQTPRGTCFEHQLLYSLSGKMAS